MHLHVPEGKIKQFLKDQALPYSNYLHTEMNMKAIYTENREKQASDNWACKRSAGPLSLVSCY